MLKSEQLGFELRFDSWAEKLEREFAIMLTPEILNFTMVRCRDLATRMAMLAAKRAREASALRDERPLIRCRGCDTQLVAESGVCLCGECGAGFRSPGSDD